MINQFKSPRDKVIILINFVYILNTMINENSKKKHSGADEVFPIIVYAILISGKRKIKSNMRYIKNNMYIQKFYYMKVLLHVHKLYIITRLSFTKEHILYHHYHYHYYFHLIVRFLH